MKFIDSKHRSQQIIDARATVQDMPPSLQDDIFWASAFRRSIRDGAGDKHRFAQANLSMPALCAKAHKKV